MADAGFPAPDAAAETDTMFCGLSVWSDDKP